MARSIADGLDIFVMFVILQKLQGASTADSQGRLSERIKEEHECA
jgi:hypothetical protein